MTPDPYLTATPLPWLAPDAPPALCVDSDPEQYHPANGSPTAATVALCRRCELRDACLTWALDNHPSGVWGGTTEAARRRLRRGAAA